MVGVNMVYDCFLYFNEDELLEIRLNQLSSYVDYFIIGEGTSTFTGKPNKLRLKVPKGFEQQVIGKIWDCPPESNPWQNEYRQRNNLMNDFADDDIVICSDIDEIPSPLFVDIARSGKLDIVAAEMDLCYYFVNYKKVSKWRGSVACNGRTCKSLTMQGMRNRRGVEQYRIANGGTHYSYLGGKNRILEKLESFSETQCNTEDIRLKMDAFIKEHRCYWSGEQLSRDDSLIPDYIKQTGKFSYLVGT
jgi:hypothetical protein